jgi:hypothetical protein
MIWSAIIPVVGQVIDKLFPDPAQAEAAKLELLKLQVADKQFTQDIESKLMLAQAEINKAEASSADPFRANWRPLVGWTAAVGLGFMIVLKPLLISLLSLSIITGVDPKLVESVIQHLPSLDTDLLMGILIPLLGLGVYRSVEKIKGVK